VGRQQEQEDVEPRRTKIFREWKGVVNNAYRNAIPDDSWYYLENMQPIGNGNIRTVNNISGVLFDYSNSVIYWAQYVNIAGTDYEICFATNGTVHAYNIITGTSSQIGSGFSGSSSRVAQWKNTVALFVDSTGYYSWDGTTFALISGTGVPTSGTDIAVCFGRVWISQNRLVTFSGANDYTAASFTVANGAGSLALTDPTLRSTVTRLSAQNGYLYIIGPTSINAISDVYVPSGASPPTPLFTNLNIQAIIGSDQPGSIFAMNQALVFCNRYGAWYLYGTNAQKISTDIDGTWKYVDFSQLISGGQVVCNNILCTAFLIKRINDPMFGSNTVLAMYHDEKWWFANFGAITFCMTGIQNNQLCLYGFIGNKLYQLFGDNTTGPATQLISKLWAMDDELADKQVIRAGFEVAMQQYVGTFNMTLDSSTLSQQAVSLNTGGNVVFSNNSGQIVQWTNNTAQVVQWFTGQYLLYNSSTPGVYAKYVGQSIQASASIYQFSALNMDYKLRARWQ
jgi:hypothetical protein